jgi:hypothetical protein
VLCTSFVKGHDKMQQQCAGNLRVLRLLLLLVFKQLN